MTFVIEKINAIASDQPKRTVPAPIARLFAKADIELPAYGKLAIGKVDRALEGIDVSERLRIKTTLRQLGVIE